MLICQNTTLSKQKTELSKIIEFVKPNNYVDFSKIGIVARSFGTAVTIVLTSEVKTIVLMGATTNPERILSHLSRWQIMDEKTFLKKPGQTGKFSV